MEKMSERWARSVYSKINYKNKDREKDIKKDVKDEFSKIEKNHLKDFKIIRDDQEIWEA